MTKKILKGVVTNIIKQLQLKLQENLNTHFMRK